MEGEVYIWRDDVCSFFSSFYYKQGENDVETGLKIWLFHLAFPAVCVIFVLK